MRESTDKPALRSAIPPCTSVAQRRASIYAPELRQKPIASRLDDPTSMLTDLGVNQFTPMRLQRRDRTFFVGAHEAAVTGDIRGENGEMIA
jgi:hypothetical protein